MRPDFPQPQDGAVAMAPPRSLGCLVLGLELEGSLCPDSPFGPRRGRLGRGGGSRAGRTGSAGGTQAGPPGVGTWPCDSRLMPWGAAWTWAPGTSPAGAPCLPIFRRGERPLGRCCSLTLSLRPCRGRLSCGSHTCPGKPRPRVPVSLTIPPRNRGVCGPLMSRRQGVGVSAADPQEASVPGPRLPRPPGHRPGAADRGILLALLW